MPEPVIADPALADVLRRAGRHAVLSHEVAAELLGLELLEPVTTRRLTVPRNRSRLSIPGWKVVRADAAPDELDVEDGLRVTSAVRTAVDLARVLPTIEALVTADSALRLGLVEEHELRQRLLTADGQAAARLRLVGRHVDPLSGSVLESALRWRFAEGGLPTPLAQYRICHEDGSEVARVDFCWPDQRLVVEADGYAFHSDRFAYRRDRERWNELTRLGWRILRFTWEDVRTRPAHVTGLTRWCLGLPRAA